MAKRKAPLPCGSFPQRCPILESSETSRKRKDAMLGPLGRRSKKPLLVSRAGTSFDPCCTSRAGTGFQARVVSFENDSIQVSGLCDTDGGMRLANRVFRIEGTTVTGRYWYSSQCSGEHCYYEVQVPEDFESHAQEPEHHLEEGGEPRGYQDEEDDDADDLLVTAHSISGFALLAVGILQTLLACGRLQKRN